MLLFASRKLPTVALTLTLLMQPVIVRTVSIPLTDLLLLSCLVWALICIVKSKYFFAGIILGIGYLFSVSMPLARRLIFLVDCLFYADSQSAGIINFMPAAEYGQTI
jgi:hypothetical protein